MDPTRRHTPNRRPLNSLRPRGQRPRRKPNRNPTPPLIPNLRHTAHPHQQTRLPRSHRRKRQSLTNQTFRRRDGNPKRSKNPENSNRHTIRTRNNKSTTKLTIETEFKRAQTNVGKAPNTIQTTKTQCWKTKEKHQTHKNRLSGTIESLKPPQKQLRTYFRLAGRGTITVSLPQAFKRSKTSHEDFLFLSLNS